ncbi:MAG TPA: Bcr/CflA family multidrug efflux MFS transporter [Bryobacteraceae bacterium]|nr:Bcr/CflA family multidrug efflux MFS transporter [Bryobacteraceae bacterium]
METAPTAPAHAPPAAQAPRQMFWLIFLLGALAALGPFSIDTYLPAFPAIAQSFHTTVGEVEVTLAVYFVGLSLGQLFYGPFADSYGRKPPLYVGLALYLVSAIGCAFSTSIGMLTVLRFFQAVGGCSSMLIARTVVRDYFPPREAARIYSFLMLVIGVSPVVAPLAGGYLVVHAGWRSTFWVGTVLGFACLISVALFLRETLPRERRRTIQFSDVLRLYARLLRDRTFMVHALAGSFVMAGLYAYLEGSPLVFIELNHVSTERFGLFFGVIAAGLIGASQINGFLVRRAHPGTILRVALCVSAASGAALFVSQAARLGGFPALLALLFLSIGSLGFAFPNATALAMAPHGRVAGNASAMLGCLQFAIGGAGGMLVSGLDNGTSIPMVAVIAAGACLALAINLTLAPKNEVLH